MSYTTHADIGGQGGHGAITPQPEGELFHAAWEPRALALTLAMGATGQWNIDMSRAARETLPHYARLSYYEVWIAALERLLAERGLADAAELEASRALHAPVPAVRVLRADNVADTLARGSPTLRPGTRAARFKVGDHVCARATRADHHTRLPGYAYGRQGVIERLHGMHVFADAHAQGLGEQAQWLYTVVFDGAELWGEASAPALRVSIDAWEPYLDAA
jgi:nitrile hydratase beta subunit